MRRQLEVFIRTHQSACDTNLAAAPEHNMRNPAPPPPWVSTHPDRFWTPGTYSCTWRRRPGIPPWLPFALLHVLSVGVCHSPHHHHPPPSCSGFNELIWKQFVDLNSLTLSSDTDGRTPHTPPASCRRSRALTEGGGEVKLLLLAGGGPPPHLLLNTSFQGDAPGAETNSPKVWEKAPEETALQILTSLFHWFNFSLFGSVPQKHSQFTFLLNYQTRQHPLHSFFHQEQ